MKRLLFMLAAVLFLTACGGEEVEESSAESSTGSDTEASASKSIPTAEEGDEEESGIVKNEIGTREIVSQYEGLEETYESGLINITITDIRVGTFKPDEVFKDAMYEGKEEVTFVEVGLSIENTSEKTVTINPGTSTLTIEEGDHIISDLLLTEPTDVGGDFSGKENKKGSVLFTLNTPIEELTSGTLIIDGSYDENRGNIGNQLQIELEF